MIILNEIKRTDALLLPLMAKHYSAPKGFVGRNICYSIHVGGDFYGAIVGGSATRYLPGRNEYLNSNIHDLNSIINNLFFHVEKVNGKYPLRNFTSQILDQFVERIALDWENKYDDGVIGFEALVELPRSGECYKRAGWKEVGITKGFSCKRVSGINEIGTDSWTGARKWGTITLRPKRVFCLRIF